MPISAGSSSKYISAPVFPRPKEVPAPYGTGQTHLRLQNQRYVQQQQLQDRVFQQQDDMLERRAGEQRFRDFQEQLGKGMVEWHPMAQKNLAKFDKELADLETDQTRDDPAKMQLRQALLEKRGKIEQEYHKAGLFKQRQVEFEQTPEGQKLKLEMDHKQKLEEIKTGNAAFKTAITNAQTALGNEATRKWEASDKKGEPPAALDQTDVITHALSELANTGQMNLGQAKQLLELNESYPEYVTGEKSRQEYRRAVRLAKGMVEKAQQEEIANAPKLPKDEAAAQAAWDRLPVGAKFTGPDGKPYEKAAPGQAAPAQAGQPAAPPAATAPANQTIETAVEAKWEKMTPSAAATLLSSLGFNPQEMPGGGDVPLENSTWNSMPERVKSKLRETLAAQVQDDRARDERNAATSAMKTWTASSLSERIKALEALGAPKVYAEREWMQMPADVQVAIVQRLLGK